MTRVKAWFGDLARGVHNKAVVAQIGVGVVAMQQIHSGSFDWTVVVIAELAALGVYGVANAT